MRSRRNLLDEIDASNLRLIRSCALDGRAPRSLVALARCDRHGCRPLRRPATIRHGVSDDSADRWAPHGRAQRSEDHFNVGLSQRSRGGPAVVSPREPSYCSTPPRAGQHSRVDDNGGGIRGGDEGTRTPDPLLAKEVLSQLSYIPTARASYPAPATRSKALSETQRFGRRARAPDARGASEPPGQARRTQRRAQHVPARRRCARGRPGQPPAR